LARNQAARSGQRISRTPSGIRFVGEIVSELRKVTWPTRQETTRLTILVMIVSITIGAILGVIDIGFSRLFATIAGT
jgi:preprotein translocase subunit SecE